MKNIVIFAGGHGAIKLQQSIAKYGKDNVNVDIIISAYDNAKSTLACRQVFDNKLLGISDLRKNHITQYAIQHDLSNGYNKSIYDWLEYRLPSVKDISANEAYEYTKFHYLEDFKNITGDTQAYDTFVKAVDHFFLQKASKNINYKDFSLANIIYSSIANMFNNSMNKAGEVMAKILRIKDNVHTISDKNGYLYAITNSGQILPDEDIISQWDKSDDPIIDMYVADINGNKISAIMDDNNRGDLQSNICKNCISNADIIIFSSGSQWTSLIPTYYFSGVNEAIEASKAAKYIIMNNIEDRDLIGCNSTWILNCVSKYIDLSDFTGVFNINAVDLLKNNDDNKKILKSTIEAELSNAPNMRYHNLEMFKYILLDYYKEAINKSNIVFDFDGTLYDKNNIEKSKDNLKLYGDIKAYAKVILSGNCVEHFNEISNIYPDLNFEGIFNDVYCNFGCNEYSYSKDQLYLTHRVCESYDIEKYQIPLEGALYKILGKDNDWYIENRGRVNLAIRPLTNREYYLNKINTMLINFNKMYNCNLVASINGLTTIDILDAKYNKYTMLRSIVNGNLSNTVYFGDSFENGNDSCLLNTGVTCIKINDLYDTNLILTILNLVNNG